MENVFLSQRADLLTYVQELHAGQTRAGGVPVWHHLDRVARLLEHILAETGEGTNEEREAIVLAALGHDALEDTDVAEPQLRERFGDRATELIVGMTNRLGDDSHAPYVEQIVAADEATRLIKLSDLYDNVTSAAFNLKLLGAEWNTTYFLPIVEPMFVAVQDTEFTTYPVTANILKELVRRSFALLHEEHARLQGD
jgi:(p)ppGpp synthase/HD superfamily hydrolase